MITKLITEKDGEKGLDEAARLLKDGELVAIPTETVYGLAANALDGNAVKNIFVAKGRPQDNPLIVHIAEIDEILPLVKNFDERARALAEAYWPGPLTMILPKSDIIPNEVCAGLDTVAIRMPSHPIAHEIIKKCGFPLAAPSANTSGKPSPTTAAHVMNDMDGKIAAVVDGGSCSVGVESTVVTLACPVPRVLRPGGVTPDQLRAVLGEVEIDKAVFKALESGEKVLSPGMKYKHYSPNAHVIIVKGDFDKFGFSLITIRNGNRALPDKYPMVYAEKLLYLKEGQYAPNHFHWYKTEDIINRGGGNALIRVYNSLPDEEIDYESNVTVHTDGRSYHVPAGTQIRLTPGESIHVQQRLYHDFSVEEGTGAVLLGEVSQCNDDNTDNRFNPPVGRFPKIEEDEPPYRLLCNEYPAAKD